MKVQNRNKIQELFNELDSIDKITSNINDVLKKIKSFKATSKYLINKDLLASRISSYGNNTILKLQISNYDDINEHTLPIADIHINLGDELFVDYMTKLLEKYNNRKQEISTELETL
jgi:hypothetical protein